MNLDYQKWQIAILVGAGIGLGCYYYYFRQREELENTNKKSKADLKKQEISIDDPTVEESKKEPEVKLSPLQEAIKIKTKGNEHFKNGKYNEAIKLYNQAIEKCPSSSATDLSQFYQNRAAAYEQLLMWSNVVDDCTSALQLNPKYLKALHRRAKGLEHTNKLDLCLEDITAACILEGFQNSTSLVLADRILKQLGKQNAQELMTRKKAVDPSNNFVKNYFKSYSLDPLVNLKLEEMNETHNFTNAMKLFNEGKYKEALAACTEEIGSGDDESIYKMEALLLRGTLNLLFGCFNEAHSDLNAIIDNANASPVLVSNALIKRASLKMQTEKFDASMEDFENAIKVNDKNPDIYHNRGQVYLLQDNLEKAIQDFSKSFELNAKNELPYLHALYAKYRLAASNQNSEELFKIIEDFTEALKKYPDCVEGYSLLAQVLCDQQQFQLADQYFEKAMKLDEKNANIHVHRGLLQLQASGNIDLALEYFQKAISIDNRCEFAFETLGTVEVQRGNLDRAVELFEKAIELAKSEMEMIHLFSLKNAAVAQKNVTQKMGIDINSLASTMAGGMAF